MKRSLYVTVIVIGNYFFVEGLARGTDGFILSVFFTAFLYSLKITPLGQTVTQGVMHFMKG